MQHESSEYLQSTLLSAILSKWWWKRINLNYCIFKLSNGKK